MKIGVDCRNLFDSKGDIDGGVGRYIYHMILALLSHKRAHEYVFFFPEKFENNSICVDLDVEKIYIPQTIPFFDNHVRLSLLMKLENFDFIFFPANTIPLFYFKKSILTVHDLAIYRNPKWFPGGQYLSRKFLFPISLKKAKQIVAISNTTKNDLIELMNVSSNKITVIHEASTINNKVQKSKTSEIPFLLFIGTIQPRKNLIRLIQAFEKVKQNNLVNSKLELWIVGKNGWKSKEIYNYASKSLYKDQIRFLSNVCDSGKYEIINKSTMLIFPSLYEGFGLPVLEAMSLGIPVVTSNLSSMKEIAGEGACLVDPYDVENISQGIEKVLLDKEYQSSLIQKGIKRSQEFSWDRAVEELINLFERD